MEPERDGPTTTEVEDFIRANDVDSRAAEDLKDCVPEIQRKVLARGDLSTARNPSAALLARIRDARVEVRGGGGGNDAHRAGGSVGLPSTKDIDDYVTSSGVGERAAEALRTASPTVKRIVLASGPITGAADPSAVLMDRIEGARSGRGGGNADVEDFIKDNELDDRAAADLRDLAPDLQRVVLARGDLRSARTRPG
ncbi:unnamed protein product [Prorocentrum cordatum]|uniref:Uncharacterized protein n=1 Tax=Prorocentrum cordatum TaxID=2364126 RepID=A0ABN9V4F2_9DINO|nr:unnamed protein product [Polarella glacialis]